MFNTWALLFLSLISSLLASPEDLFLPRIENINGTYDGFRLPTVAKPSRYDIRLSIPQEALTGGVTSFTGSENIIFQVNQSTNAIVMHSQVNITSVSLTGDTQPVTIVSHTQDERLETVTILTTTDLTTGVSYDLAITFTGNMDPINMKGFYRSEYNVNGAKEYLGTTQFQPTHARKAFPCFDEPSFKATIGLTLEYPLGFTAVANTPVLNSANETTTTTTVFQDTPFMSTYLIAFTVSKFTCTTPNVATGSIPYQVCSRPDFAAGRTLAFEFGNELMAALDAWTAYPYISTNIGKMDQFAIPDFSAGAMENWGLVTYREYMLLYDQEYTSNSYKQSIIAVIAHEFAHMWFGNLVTCEWWSYTFLNEGFARYFQYFLLNQITSLQDWEIEKQFIVAQQQSAFIVDSYVSSSSLTSNAWTPAQISNKFSTISYNKGASVYRMVENVIGSTVFRDSLRNYLANNEFSATTPDILWNTISADVSGAVLPTGKTLTDVVANWTNEAGFPVISATTNGNDVILSQKRFLYDQSATDLTEWYVPITYVISNGTTSSTPLWLEPGTTLTLSNVLSGNSWIVVNHNSAGYYRVHYDINLRSRLENALLDNHSLLTDINRAQILDDALNLARAGQIRYSEAFRLLSYLKNDTSYYPWYVANNGINYLSVRFGNDSELGQRIGSILLEHIDDNLANISLIDLGADTVVSHVDSLKWPMLWSIACRLGHPTCISEAKKQFQNLRISNISINPNIRNVVYCNALRYSDNIIEDWNFLWNRLNTIDQPHESLYILSGLGCTRNKELLSNYLDQSINSSSVIRIQDLASVWSAVYGSGSVGLEVAFEKFRTNHKAILDYYSGAISVLSGIADRFTTQAELNQLQILINESGVNSTVGVAASAALTSAQRNLQWQSEVKNDLESHFGIAGSSATTLGISVFLLFISLFVVI